MWGWFLGVAGALILALALLIYIRKKKCAQISLDSIVGERCTVIETVDNYAGSGIVRVKGTEWSARSVNEDDIFEIGKKLTIVAIEGVKLICKEV